MRPAIGIRSTVAAIITAAEAAISHAGAAPRMIRDGIVTGAIGGMNARHVAERPVRVVVDREARRRARRGSASSAASSSSGSPPGAGPARPPPRRRRRRRRSRARTSRARAPTASTRSPSTSSDPVTRAAISPNTEMISSCPRPEQAEPDHLAREQVLRADRGQQHLDHARGLLLHDAGRDPEAVGQQLAVEDQDREERQAGLGVAVGVERLGRDRPSAAGGRRRRAAGWRPAGG